MTKYNFIRQIATVLLGCLLCTQVYAQHTTEFLFSETASPDLRKTMQTNAKAVFAEINRAYDENKSGLADLKNNVTIEAENRIYALWKTSHFYCTETSITTRVLKSSNAYQVRDIPVFFVQGETDEDKYQNIVIEFTASGKISDMYIAIAQHQYAKIMGNSNEVSDLQHRQMILDYLENLRTAFGLKDFDFVSQVFHDNLLITGKILKQSDKDSVKIEYVQITKKQYLENLKKVFASNSYINAKFDNIMVIRHEENPNIYGITLLLKWESSSYSDEGWLFQMIDYEDEKKPLIWITTWQPTKDINGNPIHYNPEDIYGFGNFSLN